MNEIIDDVDFLLTLNKYGWSTFRLYVQDSLFDMAVTHVYNDPYYELISSLTKLMNDKDNVSFILYEEPGGCRFEFKRLEKRHDIIHVIIEDFVESYEEEAKEYDKVADFYMSKRQLILTFYFQLRKTYDLLKDKRYSKNRNEEFPFRHFNDFEAFIYNKILNK